MLGAIDESRHALLPISLRHPGTGTESAPNAWVDTGFTGDLALTRSQIASLGLPVGPTVCGVLADGSEIELETYTCLLQWFGEWKGVEVLASDGRYALLGVGLLKEHELHINYPAKTVSIV